MKLTAFFLLATLCRAANVTVCSSGCTTTSLQTAFDSLAVCGDIIQIKSIETQTGNYTITYRGCALNPITVTSDRFAWLPVSGQRITPSHLANMAVLATPNSSPALAAQLDGMSRPPAGWNFIGVAFTSSSGGSTFDLVDLNAYGATSSAQTPDKITFDRCFLFRSPAYTGSWAGSGTDLQNAIRLDSTNGSVKNSFIDGGFFNGVESHGISVLANPGPVTVTNTMVITSSIPVFVGGSTPSYPTYLANGATINYNYFWRPWKYNADPAQPFAADYVAYSAGNTMGGPFTITGVSNTGVLTIPSAPNIWGISVLTITSVGGCTTANGAGWRINPLTSTTFQLLNFPGCNSTYTSGGSAMAFGSSICTKNLSELKWGIGVTLSYNVGENSWAPGNCGSQNNGFTDTLRTEADWSVTNAAMGTFSMSDTTHITWSGTYRIGNTSTGADSPNTQDLGVCLTLPSTGMECHGITSFSGASLVAASPFSSAPGGTFAGAIAYAATAQLTSLTLSHNVWKNADQTVNILALDFSNGTANDGFGKTHTISQNLAYTNTSYITNPHGFGFTASEAGYKTSIFPTGYTIDHNTVYNANGWSGPFVYFFGVSDPIQPKFDASAVTNNLFGPSTTGFPFSGDSAGNNISNAANAYLSNSNVKNNVLPAGVAGSGGTGGNVISGNQVGAWVDPWSGAGPTAPVGSASAYYHAATDGTSIGADPAQLPQVLNVTVAANILTFNVTSGVNSDVKATQPCALEVSSNRNLISDLGTYAVIASLDPTATIGADSSLRSDVIVAGTQVSWPLTGVVGGTVYYGRLMCYGDTEWFSFVASSGSGSGSVRSGKSLQSGKVVTH